MEIKFHLLHSEELHPENILCLFWIHLAHVKQGCMYGLNIREIKTTLQNLHIATSVYMDILS